LHQKWLFFRKTFADNLLTPHVIQDVHVFRSSVEKKLSFLMKTFQYFYPYNALHWERTVQGPKDSFSANYKLFKEF